MMEKVLARAEQIAQAAQANRIAAMAEAAAELSGVSVLKTATGLVLRGKRLLERWLLDPALRFLGSLSQ
jgi:adenylate kinase